MTKTFYSKKELDEMGVLSRPTRWRMRQRDEFPGTVKLSSGRVATPAHLVDDWITARLEGEAG